MEKRKFSKLKSYYNSTVIEAGCDEAGRGPLAGPVVAAAVILPQKYKNKWMNDSKQLTENDRNELAVEIKNIALSWAIAEITNNEIDRINILKASIKAMHLAVDQLLIRPEHLLIDGNRFLPYPLVPYTCIIKGDGKFLSIAAASVLAKTHRDDLMKKLADVHTEYGWEHNFGYPTIEHRAAIAKFGLTPFHRLSFRQLKNEGILEKEERLKTLGFFD
jgi:ribonuclease HII